MGGAGFEPAKAVPSDLQSDPFDRSGNPPWSVSLVYQGRNKKRATSSPAVSILTDVLDAANVEAAP